MDGPGEQKPLAISFTPHVSPYPHVECGMSIFWSQQSTSLVRQSVIIHSLSPGPIERDIYLQRRTGQRFRIQILSSPLQNRTIATTTE